MASTVVKELHLKTTNSRAPQGAMGQLFPLKHFFVIFYPLGNLDSYEKSSAVTTDNKDEK